MCLLRRRLLFFNTNRQVETARKVTRQWKQSQPRLKVKHEERKLVHTSHCWLQSLWRRLEENPSASASGQVSAETAAGMEEGEKAWQLAFCEQGEAYWFGVYEDFESQQQQNIPCLDTAPPAPYRNWSDNQRYWLFVVFALQQHTAASVTAEGITLLAAEQTK